MGTPSNTISGSLDALRDAPPRTRIVEPEVGDPPPLIICTPATLPFTSSSGEEIIPLLKSFSPIDDTEPVRSSFLRTP